jgi:hypothetical protein
MGASAIHVRSMDKLTEDAIREIEQIHSSWIEFEVAGEGHSLMALCADDEGTRHLSTRLEGGGVQAAWSSSSREIFYRSGQHMMAVALNASGSEPAFGKPRALFADEYDFGQNISLPNYGVTGDGRFIMVRRGARGGSLRVVIHWTEELKQILAAGGVH